MADIIYVLILTIFFPEAFSLDTILRGTPTATPCRTTPTPPTPMPATTNASSSATGGNLIAYNLGEQSLAIFW